jgi:hypothetical protein
MGAFELGDITAPTPTITGPSSPSNADPFFVVVDFGEAVTGFDGDDATVTNGRVVNVTDVGGGVFGLAIDAAGDGPVTVAVAGNVASDLSGNENEASIPFTVTVDPLADGAMTVDIAANAATDNAGNQSIAATQFAVTVDTRAPVPVIAGPADPTSANPFDVPEERRSNQSDSEADRPSPRRVDELLSDDSFIEHLVRLLR